MHASWKAAQVLLFGTLAECQNVVQIIADVSITADQKRAIESAREPEPDEFYARQGICMDRRQALRLGLALLEPIIAAGEPQELRTLESLLRYQAAAVTLRTRMQAASWRHWRREARRPPLPADRGPFHVAMIASIGRPPFGRKAMAGVRSGLFFARERPIHFHLMVDVDGAESVRAALDTLEPWLRARGRFTLYGAKELARAWDLVYTIVPAECRAWSVDYGSPGWLRLFAPDIIRDPSVKVLAWVDAGDYVFLEDPAQLMTHRRHFGPRHVAGAPRSHALPFQLFDLPRMRRANWTQLVAAVVRDGVAEQQEKFCGLGEGFAVGRLTTREPYRHVWHFFPSDWAYEPWMEWTPNMGLSDLWSGRGTGFGFMWQEHTFPGLRDFMDLEVYCPELMESLAHYTLFAGKPPDLSEYGIGVGVAVGYHALKVQNESFNDWKGQELRCNAKARGTHLVLPFHFAPWAHRFLNFWSGAQVWNKQHRKDRDLRGSGPGEMIDPDAPHT